MISVKEFFEANEKALSEDQRTILGQVLLAYSSLKFGGRGLAIAHLETAIEIMDALVIKFGEERFEPVMKPNGDMVMRPNHYGRLVIEPTRFNRENDVSWNLANAIKYLCRYPFKNGFEDVRKARRFLELEIKYLQGAEDWSM